ncbi:tetratricopeptide repeat protein [Hyalangium sp.]|uniref:tetratricopeptide repeat protein n=1 Tax=Hyalangium sp. TaxID=2028555 RepID=UPI002D28BBF2|nr:tetratricopeptide repeat protein [Hyalangium sp.]HYH99493.1 tetratricopeptide repeat protein [Hyalangium sp.]
MATQDSAPRSLPERLVRGLIAHALGYLTATQQLLAVGGHFGWFMLVIIGLGNSHGDVMRELSQRLLWLFAALGGVDETGRGGTAEIMEVFGKVALVAYLMELLLARVIGPRSPWSLGRKWAASTALACAGYGVAFALMAGQRAGRGMLEVLPFFIGWTSLMSWWALSWGSYIRGWQEVVRRGSWPRKERTELPVNSSKRSLLLSGGALLGLGLAVGLVRPREVRGEASPGATLALEEQAHEERAAGSSASQPTPGDSGRPQGSRRCRGAPECERQCEEGSAKACGMLSELLEGGFGVAKDLERSRELARRACDMEDGVSCMRMAAALEMGESPSREDLENSEALYRRACELQNADGCAGVAYLYQGVRNGPPEDLEVVKRFFTLACELGKQEVCEKLEKLKASESPE